MKKLLGLIIVLLAAMQVSAQTTWKKQKASIMTPWGEQLTSTDVWQEYPRPSMARTDWMNLNGVWQYYKRSTTDYAYETTASKFTKAILVPFPVESALSGIMDKDINSNKRATHMYRRTFSVPASFSGKRLLLHFDAVDWRCYVYVDGKLAGKHDGGSDPFYFDITDLLKDGDLHELQVAVWDPTSDGGQPNGKQNNLPGGISYSPSSGIWQTVWLEPVSAAHVMSYEPIPDIDRSTVDISVKTSEECQVRLTVKDGEKVVATRTGSSNDNFVFDIPQARLWTPDTPNLYDLEIAIVDGGKDVDNVKGYFGMRKFSRGMVDGKPCILMNNKPLYMYGPLDQGWWPDGLLTPPSYEAMIYDLKMIKAFGMNMVRKHIKVENDLWYEWCDRNGLVVWQDMPCFPGGGTVGTKENNQQNFYRENDAIIDALRHHPSIAAWVVYNEGWGQDAENGMAHTVRGIERAMKANHDPGRFIHAVTGWVDVEMGDFIDVHSYPAPNASVNPVNERVASCGEFGGINLFVDGHMWSTSGVNYTTVNDVETYTGLYDHYTDCLQQLQKDRGLWMSVYTEITDVEQECNGLMTYDRKVLKVSTEQMNRLKDNIERTIYARYKDAVTVLAAGDESSNISWRYTTSKPADDWMNSDFSASSWRTATGGFGNGGRTSWTTSDIWLRRTFSLNNVTAEEVKDLRLWISHDEDVEVYINGVLAAKIAGFNTNYEQWPMLPEGLAALKTDGSENVLAIHCHQVEGGQFIDCGMKKRIYTPNEQLEVSEVPVATPKPDYAEDADKAYLLTYTTPSSKKVHYAYSLDGADWKEINGNRDIMPAAFADIDLNAPFVRRVVVDGKTEFHLVADPLSAETKGFYHWQSDDLVNWTASSTSPLVTLTSSDISKVESPEWIYDESSANYFVYWSAVQNGHNVVYSATTKDWKRMTAPRLVLDSGYSTHDPHIEQMGDAFYLFFYNKDRNLSVAKSNAGNIRLTAGKFDEAQRLFGFEATKVRAPQSFPAFDGKGWYLMTKGASSVGHVMLGSGDASEYKWYRYGEDDFSFPQDTEEGSVMVITREELNALLRAYPVEEYALLPTAETDPQTWRYNTGALSGTSWTAVGYRDTTWKEGKAGFGSGNPPSSVINTTWNTSVIRMRKTLDLTGMTYEQIHSIIGRVYHDEDVTVYFNGVVAFQESGYMTGYSNVSINKEALDALTPDNNNVVAVECKNAGGGQYVDFGLTAVREDKTGIKDVISGKPTSADSRIYNLQGQALPGYRQGVNITNGKKVIVE